MGEQNEQAAEQNFDELEATAIPQFKKALAGSLEKAEREPPTNENHVRLLSPVISFFAIRRQEKLLAAMNKQSDAMTCHLAAMNKQSNVMTCHSWTMIILTVVILAATIIQVIFLISNK